MKALIGIGTNMGDRGENINAAVESLALVPGITVLRKSSVYETAPWGYTEQPAFYNNVIEVESEKSPEALLGICLGIEAAMGRVRTFKNGPRVIDLDLLLCEGRVSNTTELKLPHPFISQRDFVLAPLQELDKTLCFYGFDYSKGVENVLKNSSAKKLKK